MLLQIKLGRLNNPLKNEKDETPIIFDTEKGVKVGETFNKDGFLRYHIGIGADAASIQKYLSNYYDFVTVVDYGMD